MKKNILFISNQPYPKGMAGTQRIRQFTEVLSKKNCTIKVLVLNKSNDENELKGEKNDVEYETVGLIFNHPISYIIFMPVNIYKIFNILKKNKNKSLSNFLFLYDGISIDNLLFIIIGKMIGYKVIIDVVEDYTLHTELISRLHHIKLKVNQIIENRFFFMVNGIVVISNYLENKLNERLKKKKKIILIPISAGNINQQKISNEEPKDFYRFVYSGTYGNKDGVGFLLNAFDQLSKKYPNIILTLSGKSKNKIEDVIFEYKNDKIEYVGLIPEHLYYDFLLNADALCMTRINSSYANAGFPFKLGEYLASGKPVITTNVSDISKYLIDKKDAVFAEPSNVESLVNALEFVLLNPVQSAEIGLNGRKKALQYFNPERNGEALLEFLDIL